MKKFDDLTEAFHNMKEINDDFSYEARDKSKSKTECREFLKEESISSPQTDFPVISTISLDTEKFVASVNNIL